MMSSTSNFFMGTPGKFSQQSTLGQSQQPLYNQLQEAASGGGPGGSFGQAADYYRSLLSDDNSTLQAMINPELRNFRQNIIPQIGEQFAGMGAGALNSSGYRNATLQAGTDLAERIASMRANLRQQGAQGLTGLGQQGLGHSALLGVPHLRGDPRDGRRGLRVSARRRPRPQDQRLAVLRLKQS